MPHIIWIDDDQVGITSEMLEREIRVLLESGLQLNHRNLIAMLKMLGEGLERGEVSVVMVQPGASAPQERPYRPIFAEQWARIKHNGHRITELSREELLDAMVAFSMLGGMELEEAEKHGFVPYSTLRAALKRIEEMGGDQASKDAPHPGGA